MSGPSFTNPLNLGHPKLQFSERTSWPRVGNPLAKVVAEARSIGRAYVDLTITNPTRCGLSPSVDFLASLGHPRAATYEPDPIGHLDARTAVAEYYRGHGVSVDPGQVVLTASTSESYSFLFKLLCNRGDSVLVPQPSYPLFDYLATLEDVKIQPYHLVRQERFAIHLEGLERAITTDVKAIVLVHPNNPTGTRIRREEAAVISALAARHGLALIVDEVFYDYSLEDRPSAHGTFAGNTECSTFVLSGLSKVLALPQVKLGWMAVSGPDSDEALARLEILADTYLSVGTPVQRTLPEWLGHRVDIQAKIINRCRANLHTLDQALAAAPEHGVSRLGLDGGWSVIIEVPRTRDEDSWVERLLHEGVLVQPGYLFDLDLERDGSLVLSLLAPEDDFRLGVERLMRGFAG